MPTQPLSRHADAVNTAMAYMRDLSELALRMDLDTVGRATQRIADTIRAGRTVFVAGNGGSASTASHVVCDLLGTCRAVGLPRARVVGLSDNASVLTALANDTSFEEVFAHQIGLQAETGDLLLLLSVSGESPNMLRAAETARDLGMHTIAWVGVQGSSLEKYSECCVSIDSDDYGLTEDLHLVLNHVVARILCGGEARRCRTS
ncbi:SIS domain-containing protein [Streptomyces barkulensis]|uniref:SIS domain-containing protein n=1 Tax=Streptomyces barkulensis TaxID=1257026 RepID=UPI000C6E67AC|nr:SIS domain-containing protein [Streptomyces barkulensis]